MAEYDRTSRFVDFQELRTELREEVQQVATAQGVGDLQTACRLCVETHSRRTRGDGLFAWITGTGDPDTEHWTAVVLTRHAAFVGTSGVKRGTVMKFLPLVTLELEGGATSVHFRSPSLARGPSTGGTAYYPVIFDTPGTADRVRAAVRAALAEHRSG